MDLNLGEMSGLQAVEEMRRIERNQSISTLCHIVGVSGDVQTATQLLCRDAGMQEMLSKPVMVDDVVRLLNIVSVAPMS